MIDTKKTGVYCSYCSEDSVITNDRSEIVCTRCGAVLGTELDYGCDWRAFNAEDNKNKSHIGAPTTALLHDRGLSTYVGLKQLDGTSKKTTNLRTWQFRSTITNSNDRNLSKAMMYLSTYNSLFNLTKNERETAAVLYRQMLQKNLIRGRTIVGMMIACVHAACRINNNPRSVRVVLKDISITKKKFLRCYRTVLENTSCEVKPLSPEALVGNYCSKLFMGEKGGRIEVFSYKMLNAILSDLQIKGCIPAGISASTIYISAHLCGFKIAQNEVAKVAGITENTARGNYRKIAKILKLKIITKI